MSIYKQLSLTFNSGEDTQSYTDTFKPSNKPQYTPSFPKTLVLLLIQKPETVGNSGPPVVDSQTV